MWGPASTVKLSSHFPPVCSWLAAATVAIAFSMTAGEFTFCIAKPLGTWRRFGGSSPAGGYLGLYPRCYGTTRIVAGRLTR